MPEFTAETPSTEGFGTEVSVESTERPVEQPATGGEKETPSEPPAEQTPAETPEGATGDDTGVLKAELRKEVEGLQRDKERIILELEDLRGQRRTAKQAELQKLEEEIDDLKDLHPQDVTIIDRVLRAKGYVSKGQVGKMLYEARKQDEIAKFQSEFPEYSEDNDPDRKRFGPLLQRLSLYKEPEDPLMYGTLLRREHRALAGTRTPSDRGDAVRKRQAELAGVGAGGAQRSSSVKSFEPERRRQLLDGGWSEEDIKRMEERESQ